MSDSALLLPFIAPVVVSFTLTILFLYLYLTYRIRFLGIWTAAWILWTLRMGYALFVQDMQYENPNIFIVILPFFYTTLILLGAAELYGKSVMKLWLPLITLGLIFVLIATFAGYDYTSRVVFFLILGSGWIWAGVLFANADRRVGAVRWIPAFSLIATGFHQWAVLIYMQSPAYSQWTLNVTLALQLGIAIGVLVVFNRQANIQLIEAHNLLEKSLNKALSGFLPICSKCNSIRDSQDTWHRLETFISKQTEAQFTHTLCYDCAAELYPDIDMSSL